MSRAVLQVCFQVGLFADNKFLEVAKEYKMTFQVGLFVDNKFLEVAKEYKMTFQLVFKSKENDKK